MAVLTGDAARKWLAENPNKDYRDLNTGQVISGKRSGVGNLLLGMSRPFRMVGGLGQEALMGLANAAAKARGQEQYYNKEDRPNKNILLTMAETEEMREDPLLAAGKSAAGIASYLMPVGAAAKAVGAGAKIGSAALRGAGAGALGGFGYSEKGEELGGALKGAALGGLLGGGLQAAGEIGTKLATPKSGVAAGEYTVDDIAQLSNKVKKSLKQQAKSAHLWDNTLGDTENLQFFLKNRELAGNTARETAENITKAIEKGKDLKKTGIGQIGQVGDDVFVSAKEAFENAIDLSGLSDKIRKTSDYQSISNYLSGNAGVKSAEQLDKIVMKWQDIGRKASGEVKDTIVAAAYTEGAKALRDSMRTLPRGTNYNMGLEILDSVSAVEKTNLIPKGLQGVEKTGIHPPFSAGANVSVSPVVEAADKVRAAIGRTWERGLYSPTIGGALGQAPSLLKRGVVPGLIGMGGAIPEKEGSMSYESSLGGAGIGQTSQKLSVQEALSLAQQIMPNASESETMSLAKMLMTESSPDVSVASISAQGALADIDKLVNIISENNGVPFSSALPFGGFSEEGQVYKNAARNVYDLVTRTRTGAALNQSEEEFYKQFVPGITDTPASIQDKIKRLQSLYSSLAGEASSTTFFPQQQISDQYMDY
jgi:hypothetical protein